jgi:hypothetical protein
MREAAWRTGLPGRRAADGPRRPLASAALLQEVSGDVTPWRYLKEPNMRALILLVLAACASSPRAAVPESPPQIPEPPTQIVAAALDPVGEFEYSANTPDGPVSGAMTIRGTPGNYTGSIDAGAMGMFPVRGVTVSGRTMTIASEHPEGQLELRLTFVGDEFTGSWHLGMQSGEVAGKRKR